MFSDPNFSVRSPEVVNTLRLLVPTILALALNSVDNLMAGVITMDYTGSTWTIAGHNTVFTVDEKRGGLANDPATLSGGTPFLQTAYATGLVFATIYYSASASNTYSSGSDAHYDDITFDLTFTGDVTYGGYQEGFDHDRHGIDGAFVIHNYQGSLTETISNEPTAGSSLNGVTATVTMIHSTTSLTIDFATTSAAVPEPSTAIAMGLLSVLGFAGNRRRRRQS